jgi:hypothetical protein
VPYDLSYRSAVPRFVGRTQDFPRLNFQCLLYPGSGLGAESADTGPSHRVSDVILRTFNTASPFTRPALNGYNYAVASRKEIAMRKTFKITWLLGLTAAAEVSAKWSGEYAGAWRDPAPTNLTSKTDGKLTGTMREQPIQESEVCGNQVFVFGNVRLQQELYRNPLRRHSGGRPDENDPRARRQSGTETVHDQAIREVAHATLPNDSHPSTDCGGWNFFL